MRKLLGFSRHTLYAHQMSFKLPTRLFCKRHSYHIQHFHTVAMTSSWSSLLFSEEAILKNAEVNMRNTHTGGLTSHLTCHKTTVNQTFLSFIHIHFVSLQCINEEGFRLFLKTYLEVEDFPVDLCQRLFRSFQNSEATQEDSASEIIHHVLTQLSASSLLCSRPLSIYAMAYLADIHLSPHACEALFVQIW